MLRLTQGIAGIVGTISIVCSGGVMSAPIAESVERLLILSPADGPENQTSGSLQDLQQTLTQQSETDKVQTQSQRQTERKKSVANTTRKVKISQVNEWLWQDANAHHDYWIYDTRLSLIRDRDRDGFYSGFALEVDADTAYQQRRVYLRLYLQRGSELYEYHQSAPFTISGEREEDSLRVDTNLVEGFDPYDYNLVVELYLWDTDEFVAVRTQFDDSDLSLVPLESQDREVSHQHRVVSNKEGGSLLWLLWGGLMLGVGRWMLKLKIGFG